MSISNIYNFTDYREFLKDRYRQLKESDPVFSFRTFSKEAGFGSPNYLKLVMDSKRNLSEEAIPKFAKGLRLDIHESEFFKYMVELNQCQNPIKRQVYEAKLMYLRELFKVKAVIPELYDYYHDWYHAAIHELVKKGGLKNNPSEICQRLVPSISEEEARNSLALMTKLNFIQVQNDGTLRNVENSGVDVQSVELAQKIHHEQMAELAAQSVYTQTSDTQEFDSVTIRLPIHKVKELKVKIKELLDSLQSQNAEGKEEAVFQFNIQLFALTKPTTEEQKSLEA